MPPVLDAFPTAGRPVPARGIMRLDPARFGPDVPADTRVSADGAAVEYRTAAAAVLPPVVLANVERVSDPAGTRLRLSFGRIGPAADARLPSGVDTDRPTVGLRLFVGRPDVYHALTVAPVTGERAGRVSADVVRPVGFDVADALLPADPREPEAVRLLAEWAVCPEKFLFVDLVGLAFDDGDGPLDLVLGPASTAALADGVPPLRLGCVPVLNRRVVELPPVPLRRAGPAVQLDVDPLAEHPPRVVLEVLAARAVRAGRTVATYAERMASVPPPLAVRRVGAWALERRGEGAWLSLADRGPVVGGRTLLVTAACCRRALPDGPTALAAGAAWVGPVRPPVWPTPAVGFEATPIGDRLAAVCVAFGRPEVAAFVGRCDAGPASMSVAGGVVHGTAFRLTVVPGGMSPAEAYLLVRVLDHAVATAAAVDGFTQLTAMTAAGEVVCECPPRAGKDVLAGTATGGRSPEPRPALPPLATGRRSRSDEQAAAVARTFAAVTRPTSVTSLAAVLRYLLDVPVRVRPFELARVGVAVDDQLRLGGAGRVLGRRRPAWGLRVEIGPLDRRTFDRFGPGTRATRRVRQLIVAAVGPACPVEVEPVLRAADGRPWRLGVGRLGRSLRVGPLPVH